MTGPNKNALTPESLAANGMQGVDAVENLPHHMGNDSARARQAIRAARCALDEAREHLALYATLTDEPDWRAVDAADLLDAARAALDGAP